MSRIVKFAKIANIAPSASIVYQFLVFFFLNQNSTEDCEIGYILYTSFSYALSQKCFQVFLEPHYVIAPDQ